MKEHPLSDLRPRTIRNDKIKTSKEKFPAGLSRIQSFGGFDILKVFVFRENGDLVFSPLKPVPPLLKSQFDGQEFPITHIVIPFSIQEFAG